MTRRRRTTTERDATCVDGTPRRVRDARQSGEGGRARRGEREATDRVVRERGHRVEDERPRGDEDDDGCGGAADSDTSIASLLS